MSPFVRRTVNARIRSRAFVVRGVENKKERREHAGKNDQARGRKKKTVGIKQSLVGQCISIMSDAIAVPFSIDSSIVVCARISVVDGRDKEIVHEAQPSLILPLTDAGLSGHCVRQSSQTTASERSKQTA